MAGRGDHRDWDTRSFENCGVVGWTPWNQKRNLELRGGNREQQLCSGDLRTEDLGGDQQCWVLLVEVFVYAMWA